jgi:hypothetical protein
MNERIKELWEQAVHDGRINTSVIDVFAELIVRECAKSLWTEECHNSDLALEEFERNSAKIKEHFGVEE